MDADRIRRGALMLGLLGIIAVGLFHLARDPGFDGGILCVQAYRAAESALDSSTVDARYPPHGGRRGFLHTCGDLRRMNRLPMYFAQSVLRVELLARVARDQAVRDTLARQLTTTGSLTTALMTSMQRVDSANLSWLKRVIRERGFPTRSAVGRDGVLAAALLVQHADADPAFQAEVLPMLEDAYRAGDALGQEIAMLADRVAKAQGRPQRYGTQTTITDGIVRFDPIADSAHVDARRIALGLPTLANYKQLLDSMYAKRVP